MESSGPETSRFSDDTRNEAHAADGRSNSARASHLGSRPVLRNLVALSSPFRVRRRSDVGARRGHGCPGEIPLRNLGIVALSAFHMGSTAEPGAGYAFGWRPKVWPYSNRLKSPPANRAAATSSTDDLRASGWHQWRAGKNDQQIAKPEFVLTLHNQRAEIDGAVMLLMGGPSSLQTTGPYRRVPNRDASECLVKSGDRARTAARIPSGDLLRLHKRDTPPEFAWRWKGGPSSSSSNSA
ncbi:hypothetical protein FBZ94_11067 [Bradyrhizobium sacchari]|uniref:Uncharacterized protein n=1 Tax=Bradyrhizobium sacchari TaxID=1399419 RepID=A0A560JE36_9BRAD|nr:hypothetical protein FBZ94_11067 [Bradyrhizobium sacchari]TWB69471.1 hypothetical protein FBZ95_10967 [Bradyrhizobium sacchari]